MSDLTPGHCALLAASAVFAEVAEAAGVRSVSAPGDLPEGLLASTPNPCAVLGRLIDKQPRLRGR